MSMLGGAGDLVESLVPMIMRRLARASAQVPEQCHDVELPL